MLSSSKKHLELAILAGERLVESGAETYRVEDTMMRILAHSQSEAYQAFAYSTGLFASINDEHESSQTQLRRIHSRSINLSTIANVNAVSRAVCTDELTLDNALQQLKSPQTTPYTPLESTLGLFLLVSGFSLLLGGSVEDALLSILNAFALSLFVKFSTQLKANSFIETLGGASLITLGAYLIHHLFPFTHLEILIVSSMMPLVPGTAITNAIRDTLYGDYMSGAARALEAVVIAASVALGVGLGLALVGVWL